MADLNELQSALTVKLAGAAAGTGVEDNFLDVDSSGRITVNQGAAGSANWLINIAAFGGTAIALGQAVMASSIPVVLASNQSSIPVTQSGTWTTARSWTLSSGGDSVAAVQSGSWSVTANVGTTNGLALDATLTGGTQRTKITDGTNNAAVKAASTAAAATDPALVVAVSPNNTVAVTQSGTWTTARSWSLASGTDSVTSVQGTAAALSGAWPVKMTDGTNVRPTADVASRADFTKLTDGTNTAAVKAASTAASATDPALVVAVSPNNSIAITMASGGYGGQVEGRAAAGAVIAGNPVYMGGTDGTDARGILVDTQGRIITAPAGTASSANGFAYGNVLTAATTISPVRATTYTEQTTNGQRSLKSSSASDAAAGTGARQIKITYYDQTCAGPFTETVTLNGTTAVNTVSTTICFIEDLEVVTTGTGGANAGTITLNAGTGGTGTVIATIGSGAVDPAAGDNETFWTHHYVPTGKSCYITGVNIGHNGTTVGSGAIFFLRSKDPTSSTSTDGLISDVLRLYGQSSTTTRNYGTPIVVPGPARITMYVVPETSSSTRYRGSFDFYEQ